MRLIDADILIQDTIQEYARSKQYRDAVIRMVNKAPTVEPKRGEWIDRSDGGRILNPWWENYECNRCGYYGSGTWNFCPNCGADMREREGE